MNKPPSSNTPTRNYGCSSSVGKNGQIDHLPPKQTDHWKLG
jgi:hypothetical protein